jgi:hypothetical protein
VPATGTIRHQLGDVSNRGGDNEPDDKSRGVFDELVGLAIGLEVNLTTDSVAKVDLAIEDILESRRVGVWKQRAGELLLSTRRGERKHTLEVGHEGLGTTVQGIDDHLAVSGAGDFDPAIFQAGRRWCADPGGISADVAGLRGKVELLPRVETLLDGMAGVEELQTRKTM